VPRPSPHTVRQATKSDVKPLSASLARAFSDDPVMTWLFPEARQSERVRQYFAMYLNKVSLRYNITYTTANHEGGAIWLPPGKWELTPWDIVRTLPSTVRALGTRMPFALKTLLQVEKSHPHDPHYYLATLGTDTAHQGTGVGTALLEPVLERCDAEGVPAYLESSKERNIAFYARHGFEVTKELDLLGGGPRIWLMWRNPRSA
jgi:ribosomal protein S18 acetylase RimI-like enzyme